MPAPTNANGLSLGRPVIDATTIDTMEDVRANFAKLSEVLVGMGFWCGAQSGDTQYLAVVAEDDGGGGHLLWGGNPTDPLSPIPITVSASGSATVIWQEEGSTVKTSGTVNFVGAGVTVTDEGDGKATVTIPGGGGGGSTNAFGTIQVLGQSDVVADAAPDTVEFIAGTGMVLTTSAAGDTVTWAIDTAAVAQNSFTTIAVSGQSNVVADSPTDTLTLVAGSNITITTNAGSDSVTINSTGGVYTGGDGIEIDGSNDISVDYGPGLTIDASKLKVLLAASGGFQILGFDDADALITDFAGIAEYDADQIQYLTHTADGGLKWVTPIDCES